MTLTRRLPFRSFPVVLLVLATTTFAHAADNYLKVIPGTALAWGAVNHVNEAGGKVQKLAALVQGPGVNILDQIKKEAGIVKGLDEKGAAGFFMVPGKTEKEGIATATFFAVTDEKELFGNFEVVKAGEKINEVRPKTEGDKPKPKIEGFGAARSVSSSYLCFRNGYAVLSPKSGLAAVQAAVEATQDMSAEMVGLEEWLATNDGNVVGTAAGIKFAAKAAGEELKKSKDNIPNGPEGAMLHSLLDLYGATMEAAPKEFSLAVAGIRCDKEGSIRIIGRARFVSGGQVSQAVTGIPPLTENLFAGTPGGSFALAAAGVAVPKLADAYRDLAAGLMKSMKSVEGMPAEDLERLGKGLSDVFRQVRSMSFVLKTGQRGDPICSNIFYSLRVDNSQRILDLLEQGTESANKLVQNAKPGMLKSITVKRLEIAGKPALQQEVHFDLSSLAGPGVNRALVDEVLGIGGNLLFYHVAADEHTVFIGVGVSQERMAAALDMARQPKKSLAADADVTVTAAMLPANAQWVAYVNERGYVQLTMRLMAAAWKGNAAFAELFSVSPFPKCPPFGYAIEATPTELHVEIAAPSSLVQAYVEYVHDMQKRLMNRGMQPNQTPGP